MILELSRVEPTLKRKSPKEESLNESEWQKIFETFARSRRFDPRNIDTWYSMPYSYYFQDKVPLFFSFSSSFLSFAFAFSFYLSFSFLSPLFLFLFPSPSFNFLSSSLFCSSSFSSFLFHIRSNCYYCRTSERY